MSSKAMSLKGRLKNLSKQKSVSAQILLQNYMFERLLERLSMSPYKETFILKGGMLVAALVGIGNRSTMDIDATVRAFSLNEENLKKALGEICAISLDDGVNIRILSTCPIRKDDVYGGLRISLEAVYDAIKTPFTIDVTAGDVITPKAVWYKFHGMLDETVEFEILAYNIETVIAEKCETILRRGALSTRPRDFYDVYILSKTQKYNQEIFHQAFWATAAHRNSSSLLQNIPEILEMIQESTDLQSMWSRYRNEYAYAADIEYSGIMEVMKRLAEQIKGGGGIEWVD